MCINSLVPPFIFYSKKNSFSIMSISSTVNILCQNAYHISNLKSIINIQYAIATFFNKSKALTFFVNFLNTCDQ